MKTAITLPQEGFVRLPAVLAAVAFSKSTLWSKIARGEFPRPVKLGPRISAWHVDSVRQYIDTHTAKAG
jgi:prophage regulatory protein